MGDGVIEHRMAGGEGSSLSESYGDSRAAKGLGEANREYVGLRGNVVWGRGEVVCSRENASRSTGGGPCVKDKKERDLKRVLLPLDR